MAPATTEKKPKKPTVPKFIRQLSELAQNPPMLPHGQSPVCANCKLDNCGARSPYMKFRGSQDPLLTVIFDSVSRKEDDAEQLACEGSRNGLVKKFIEREARDAGLDTGRIRYLASSRCANRSAKKVNYQTHGRWCRHFIVQELLARPPRAVLPVGTTVLGLLSHKSNANSWAGRVLNWRGWPDAWLIDGRFKDGHPFFGPKPTQKDRVPMVPIQAPHIIYRTQNPAEQARWHRHMRRAVEVALHGSEAPTYDRPWFHLLEDPDEVIAALDAIPSGLSVTYDTETTGLLMFAKGAKIVFVMLRYRLPDGQPVALAFPWDYEESPLLPHLARLAPHLLEALYRSRVNGHNLSFDALFTYATVPGADLEKLTNAMDCDTLHLLYTYRQTKEFRGLELCAYDWCPEMAGYEEDFELLKMAMPELLDPELGGHYAKCPKELWPTHLKPYVFGDVEVAGTMRERLLEKLRAAKSYRIPLSDPAHLGHFRSYTPMHRTLVYRRIMLPSQRVLTRMMARGMHVDVHELDSQEDKFPKMIKAARVDLRRIDERIIKWCEHQEATTPGWALDLEDRDQLKTILFDILELPVKRLTDAGMDIWGEELSTVPKADQLKYAAIDKYTLNGLAAEHPQIKPLQTYRKLYKAWTTFVRSMRNVTAEGVDKKEREKDQYLMADGRVHTSFLQTGTRGGRLSSRNPNMQQLPKESIVKRMYSSRFGERGCIYSPDLSQIELRILAAACGDPLMVKTYRDGTDIHSVTMSRVYKLPYDHCLKDYAAWLQKEDREEEAKKMDLRRTVSKRTNFLTSYGGGGYGLQTTLAEEGVFLTLEECERIVEALFDAYPKMREHIGLYKQFILDTGVAVSLSGRIRVFEEIYSDDQQLVSKALRSGFNHLIQPTASDMLLTCAVIIEAAMREAGLESILVSTVHDSLVFDAVRAEMQKVHEIAMDVLNNIPEILEYTWGEEFDSSWLHILPFEADAEVGLNYLDMKKIEGNSPDWDALLNKK
jgi:DNA polymerase I-like protein with 3'-5' exonuclease and polymerase domains